MWPTETLPKWHDFFLLIGGASATLVGLVFVTVSLAMNLPKLPRTMDRMLFTSPIVAQYGYALGLCALSVVPFKSVETYGGVILTAGAAASFQMTWVIRNLFRRHAEQTVTRRYWLWSGAMPFIAALVLLASGGSMLFQHVLRVEGVAAAVLLLALTGVRNSWMLVSWFFDQRERHAAAQAADTRDP